MSAAPVLPAQPDREAVAAYVDMRHPSAPPDVRCELIDEYLEADFEARR